MSGEGSFMHFAWFLTRVQIILSELRIKYYSLTNTGAILNRTGITGLHEDYYHCQHHLQSNDIHHHNHNHISCSKQRRNDGAGTNECSDDDSIVGD